MSSDATQQAGERLSELVTTIADNESYCDTTWTGATIIVTMVWRPDFETVKRFSGYLYTEEALMAERGGTHRWRARTPSRTTAPAFVALARAVAERDGKEPWKHCLFQLDRASGAVNVEFSYSEDLPWHPDFGDLDNWVERLRPPSHRV